MNTSSFSVHIPHWYKTFQPYLIQIGLKMGYSKEEASDFVHQFFLELLEKEIDPTGISHPQAYLSTAFKRKLIDHHRSAVKKQHLYVEAIENGDFEPSVQEKLEQFQYNAELVAQLKKAYHNLPERCKKVIYLKFFQGLTIDEIASQTGLAKRSVYNNLFEGVKMLRAELRQVAPHLQFATLLSLLPFLVGENIF